MTALQFQTDSERTFRSSGLGGSAIPKILLRSKRLTVVSLSEYVWLQAID